MSGKSRCLPLQRGDEVSVLADPANHGQRRFEKATEDEGILPDLWTEVALPFASGHQRGEGMAGSALVAH
jgi:hypothetical protein